MYYHAIMQKNFLFFKVHVTSISQEFISVCLKDLSQYQIDVSLDKLLTARSRSIDVTIRHKKGTNRPMLSNVSPIYFSLPFAPWFYSPLFDIPYRWLHHGLFHLKGPKQGNSPFFK